MPSYELGQGVFWVAVAIIGLVVLHYLATQWRATIIEFNKIPFNRNPLQHFRNIAFKTVLVIICFGAIVIQQSSGTPGATTHFNSPSATPRNDFIEAIKQEEKAVKPILREDLEEQRRRAAEDEAKKKAAEREDTNRALGTDMGNFRQKVFERNATPPSAPAPATNR